jgi:hypothetical protein
MAKSMGLEKVKYFDPKELKRVASEHVRYMNDRVTVKSQDADGTKFPEYTKDYADKKAVGFGTDTKGGRKGGLKQMGLSRQTHPPDFRLRGLTMKNLRFRKASKDFYEIGWDGEAAAIVEGNAGRGRDIISNIPDHEWQFILKRLGISVEKEWKKLKNVTVVIGK